MNTDRPAMQTPDLADEKFRALRALFPQAITETKDADGNTVRAIDADVLRQEINTHVVSGPQERYRFTWPDKRTAQRLANTPTTQCLRPCRAESVDFDSTQNLYIEGDNLEVLKILRESYLGKVKMIYIDPPYNTGHDFVYEDDFAQASSTYDGISGQKDEHGNRLFQNTETNGRFHTDWLNMIYPRLVISRCMLADDGVIFISIDDNEIGNLSKIASEVFGERNFICQFIWKSKLGKVGTTSTVAATHEYILCYAKKLEQARFKFIQNFSESRKESLRQWGVADRREDRPSMWYPININGVTVYPYKEDGTEGRWRVGEEMAKKLMLAGDLELVQRNGKHNIIRKFPEGISHTPYETLLTNIGPTSNGAKELREMDMIKTFDYSKPVDLVKHFAFLCTQNADLIMDFFSGSATTAHAVMKLNAEDGGKRKFIMVQLPEETDEKSEAYKAGYKTICEIGKERIRRAAKKIREENPGAKFDGGFRVLKCDSSNMEDVFYTPEEIIKDKNLLFTELVKPDRSGEDLLFQVMPEYNIPLSESIEKITIGGKTAYEVGHGYLLACFEDGLTKEHICAFAERKPVHFVTLDRSLAADDMVHNLKEKFRTISPNTVSCKTL